MRAAFVGLGWWGSELAAAASRTAGRVEIASCWSPDADQRHAFAARFGCPVRDSFAAILDDAAIEAVVLATPHSLHTPQVIAAAEARKHVFVEKPLALTTADAIASVVACQEQEVILAVGHNRRLLPQFGLLADAVGWQMLGDVTRVAAEFSTAEALSFPAGHWRTSRAECPGGAMSVLGVHLIDWLHLIFGRVASASGRFSRRVVTHDMDDTASARLVFASGPTADLTCNYAAAYANRFRVEGSAVTMEIVAEAPESETIRPLVRKHRADGTTEDIAVPHVDTLRLQLEQWADACAGQGAPAVDGIDAARNVAVLEAIVRSAAHGGAETPVEYGDLWPS